MTTCNASVTWYREPGHVMVNDRCVLENGHEDFDHLPAGKAAEQVENRLFNAGIDAVAASIDEVLAEWSQPDVEYLANKIRKRIADARKP